MEKSLQLKNKKITVMGLGLNQGGLGVAKYLAKAGAKLLITDLKTEKELASSLKELKNFDNIQYTLGKHRDEDFINKDMIIQNPAVPHDSKYLQIARAHSITVETDLSLFLKICPSKKLIAVGGTKGKSTVTNLIYHIFHQARKDIVQAGNIGISVFEVLPVITSQTIVLLEISSWQLEGLAQMYFRPPVAVLTNIMADHLDRYDVFDDYVCSEKLIYKYQNKSDYLITSMDNLLTKNITNETQANIFWFSTKNKVTQGSYLDEDNKLIFIDRNKSIEFARANDIKLPGFHNISNILAAANVCFIYNLPLSSIKEGIKSFPGVPNRLEKIKTLKGINFYNDTCATTPDATIAALQSFPTEPLILILGGKDKKLNYDELCQVIKRKKNIAYLFILQHSEYNASELIWNGLQKLNLKDKIECCSSLTEAVQKAYHKAHPGTNIILSPAATSFGMFSNEFERGNVFRETVANLS